MSSPMENLHPDHDPELVFAQSGRVSAQDVVPPEQFEEGEVSELEDQPDLDNIDTDRAMNEDHNYRETICRVRAFMGWTHIPDLEYSPATRADNPWIGHRSQPVGKFSVLPLEDWLCKKLENLNLVLIEGYPSKSTKPGGLHVSQYLCHLKSQSRWYGIHPAEPKDPSRPGKYANSWLNDAGKLNSAFARIAKSSVASSQPPSRP